MQRLGLALALLCAIAAVGLAMRPPQDARAASPPSGVSGNAPSGATCDPNTNTCTVQVDPPPPSGTSSPPTDTSTGGSDGGTGCVGADGKDYPCYDPEFGYWFGKCYWKLMDPQPGYDTFEWAGHPDGDGAIYFYTCPPFTPGGDGGEGMEWEATQPGAPTVTPEQVAREALKKVQLPSPTTGRSPSGTLRDGVAYTVVQIPTWFWTDPATYETKSAEASEDGVWAQVTVTPTALTFAPGDGGATVSCTGPGRAWVAGQDGQFARAPGGCDYSYRRSTFGDAHQQLTATYSIDWSVAWIGSGGAAGTLPDMTTSTDSTFAVAEAQAVITG